ncbi:MAG TPA: acireductone dioxygenase [Azospirillaceae bacterium]|nr:acireductone dioxygenase [Azospirillaceae bacterium]
MTRLSVHLAADPARPLRETSDYAAISAELRRIGAHFDRWATPAGLNPDADAEAIMSAFAKPVDYLCRLRGYLTTDVARIKRGDETAPAMRAKFLAEHTHSEDEARFFVEGGGCFYLRNGDQVLALACEAGDLLLVPAGARHWFDIGLDPFFTAIRFFNRPEGWVASFTGDPIAERFPAFAG